LRQQVQEGCDQLDRGDFTDYDEEGLEARFNQLRERVQSRFEGGAP
jgi:hypothetical protein